MPPPRDAVRRQRRRELDARRSKSRVRLGACLQSWGQLKQRLGFALHSELAQYLLESYFSKVCDKCSGGRGEIKGAGPVVTSAESLQCLVLQVHHHGQRCPFPPALERGGTDLRPAEGRGDSGEGGAESGFCLRYACRAGHVVAWGPSGAGPEAGAGGGSRAEEASPAKERGRRGAMEEEKERSRGEACGSGEATVGSRHTEEEVEEEEGHNEEGATVINLRTTDTGESKVPVDECVQEVEPETERDHATSELPQPQEDCQLLDVEDTEADGPDVLTDQNYVPSPKRSSPGRPSYRSDVTPSAKPARETNENPYPLLGDPAVIQQKATRGRQTKAVQSAQARCSPRISKKENKRSAPKRPGDDDVSQISGKRKRKATPRDILPCEFDGCGKIFSSRQYLNHHMKYQHFHQKTFACSDPSCGKSFNFKKHLKEHEKLHSNQRDYICEFCARAFRTSSNLIIHRRIHTGEKPLQCEVCGFTCRQKASLNWHMRKHDAESSYQFPCEVCGRRFEKRDNVTAHRSKSHPDHTPAPNPADHTPSPAPKPGGHTPGHAPGPAPATKLAGHTPGPTPAPADHTPGSAPGPAPATDPAAPITKTPSAPPDTPHR